MSQQPTGSSGLHVGIIMDGNGRWAQSQGQPRIAGHKAGVEALRRTVESAPHAGVATLTVYAFSADNWKRPETEVRGLMALLGSYLRREVRKAVKEGVRVSLVGRKDRLPGWLLPLVRRMEAETAHCRNLHLRLAIDYSSRDAILAAAAAGARTREEFTAMVGPDVDLLIRTSGEQRLSDFLLWECAYAEFVFTKRHWPEFGAGDLAMAVEEFRGRTRRFGALKAS